MFDFYRAWHYNLLFGLSQKLVLMSMLLVLRGLFRNQECLIVSLSDLKSPWGAWQNHQHSAWFLLPSNNLIQFYFYQLGRGECDFSWLQLDSHSFSSLSSFSLSKVMPVGFYTHEVEIYQSLYFTRNKPSVTINLFFFLFFSSASKTTTTRATCHLGQSQSATVA